MKKILFVDDSKTMQKVATLLFGDLEFLLSTASSLEEAISQLAQADVVIVDGGLKQNQAYQLASLRKQAGCAHVPVLLMTSAFHPYDTAQGESSLVDAVIEKPFEAQALLQMVEALLAGQRKLFPKTYHEEVELLENHGASSFPNPLQEGIPLHTPLMPRLPFLQRAPLPAPIFMALSKWAERGKSYEHIANLSADMIAEIAWEVIPELARVMIKQELAEPGTCNKILTSKEPQNELK